MVSEQEVRDFLVTLPGVEVASMYGQEAFKVKGKFLTRIRAAGESDSGALVLKVDFIERDALMSMQPETFFPTPHYQNYRTVLVRLEHADREQIEDLLTESWRQTAPKMMVREFDAARAEASR